MNNVSPKPIRGALTGFNGVDVATGVSVWTGVLAGVGVLSGDLPGLFETAAVLGRLLFGFVAGPELAGFCFGRDVRNAPRTSSCSCGSGAAVPMTIAQRQTNPNTITLTRITESPYRSNSF
jgi:hypothetical protein